MKELKRKIHRIIEEVKATIMISKILGLKKALKTFVAKIDIQIMNHNGYYENERRKNNLIEKHNIMIEYYEKTFGDFIINYDYSKYDRIEKKNMDQIVWICWWQGLENAPDIVKKCVASIKKNIGNKKLIIIDENNYTNYVKIPKIISDKREKGIITRTNYSDLLRLSLLAEYGGMWLDSTFFCVNNIEKYFNLPLWSIKRPDYFHASVASGYFAGYSLYCNEDNRKIFAIIRDFFIHYWENNDTMVDYLMVDYMIALVIKNYPYAKKMFGLIPNNNDNCDELFKIMNNIYEEEKWNEIKKDTSLFKLTWKYDFKLTNNNKETYYSKLIKEQLK